MRALIFALALCLASPVLAVLPDEILPDPGLEARAREISTLIRCPVCQGENIDDSGAPIARDLRLLIRERLKAGDSDTQVVDYIVARYGEFILFQPRAAGANLILWVAGPAMLLLGLGAAAVYVGRRRRAAEPTAAPLTVEEEARLAELLKQ
jgi:cytochrome c-type biogenesis protein CcmH